jgi:hypothetical protein
MDNSLNYQDVWRKPQYNLTAHQQATQLSSEYEVIKVLETSNKKRTLHIRFK